MNVLVEQFNFIAGPCAIESYAQLDAVASNLSKSGVKYLRGGAFKPRTNVNSFQGLGKDGLVILKSIAKKYNMVSVSEILDVRELENAIDYVDIIQIGSRNMQNFPLLIEAGKINKPVLLKRGFMSTIDEFICAGEYILRGGNDKLVFCERGIRSFDPSFKALIDFQGALSVKKATGKQVIIDLSHSMYNNDFVIPLAKAVRAVGMDGIMAEVHDNPSKALSDKNQLSLKEFNLLYKELNI